jgi:hypothetical protein
VSGCPAPCRTGCEHSLLRAGKGDLLAVHAGLVLLLGSREEAVVDPLSLPLGLGSNAGRVDVALNRRRGQAPQRQRHRKPGPAQSCTYRTAIAPSPTAEATRLVEPERTSPTLTGSSAAQRVHHHARRPAKAGYDRKVCDPNGQGRQRQRRPHSPVLGGLSPHRPRLLDHN